MSRLKIWATKFCLTKATAKDLFCYNKNNKTRRDAKTHY